MPKNTNYLEKEIIKSINKFGYSDYKGLEDSIKGYKFETIRRKAKDLADEKIVITQRGKNGNKILSLSDEGKKIAKKLESNFLMPSQIEFIINQKHFDNFLEGKIGFIEEEKERNKLLGFNSEEMELLNFDSKDIDLLGMDLDEEFYSLFIQRESGKEGMQELFLRILNVKNINKIKFIFIQIFEKEFEINVEKFIERFQDEKTIINIFKGIEE